MKNPLPFQITHIIKGAGYVQLIAHLADREPASALIQFLKTKFPNDEFQLTDKPDQPNSPRWIVFDCGTGIQPKTVAQFEPEFGFLAKQLAGALNAQFGDKFAVQEIKPGVRVRSMVPDPLRPGHFMAAGEEDMTVSDGGLLLPANLEKKNVKH